MISGQVSIRNRNGDEIIKIVRETAPVWSLQWAPPLKNNSSVTAYGKKSQDVLIIADFNQTISYYSLSGKQIADETRLNYDPCTVSFLNSGNQLLVGGSNRGLHLYTATGVHIGPVCERDGWVMCARARPGGSSNLIAVGTHGMDH
jgi:intraflagellar transport protein 122